MIKKGLGKGLDALFESDIDVSTPSPSDEQNTSTVKLSDIDPNENQPRKLFYDDSLEELAESIRIHGIIQPLALRKTQGGRYEIIAGERRFRAARRAGLTEVPAIIVDVDEKEMQELALIENLQREDLNPVEEAEGIKALLERFSLTQEAAAARLGKPRASLANALRLLALSPDALALLREGKIERGHAKVLLSLPKELQDSAAQKVVENDLNVRQTETLVKRLLEAEKEPSRDSGEVSVNYLEALERTLAEKLGRKAHIVNGKRKGRIELEFYGNEDLERLIDALGRMKIGG